MTKILAAAFIGILATAGAAQAHTFAEKMSVWTQFLQISTAASDCGLVSNDQAGSALENIALNFFTDTEMETSAFKAASLQAVGDGHTLSGQSGYCNTITQDQINFILRSSQDDGN